MPTSLYARVQEMGRVDRNLTLAAGENRYEIHLSFAVFISLYVRVMQGNDTKERNTQLIAMFEVLGFIITPNECFHITMEKYFKENTTATDKQPCEHFCSFCTNDHIEQTGRFYCDKLRKLCDGALWKFTLPSSDKVIKFLKDNRSIIFHEDDVPDKVVGPIHALALQLLSKGIFNLGIANENKHFIGTPQLQVKHVVILKGTILLEMMAYRGHHCTRKIVGTV